MESGSSHKITRLVPRPLSPLPSFTTMATMYNATQHSSLASQIYSSVDFDSLNWFERHWAMYYMWVGHVSIATGLAAFVMHEVSSQCHRDVKSYAIVTMRVVRIFWT